MDKEEFNKSSHQNDKITATILSTGKKVRVQGLNIIEFNYNVMKFDEASDSKLTMLPGTASADDIIALFDKEYEFPNGIGQCICSYLMINEMEFQNVKAASCSSISQHFPLKECLTPNPSTWWISAMPCPQYVEFEINKDSIVRQIGIKIPPLPQGPLSVRQFHMSVLDPYDGKFIKDDRIFETMDTGRLQLFAVDPPIVLLGDKPRFRIVCTKTAKPYTESIGFFSIIFG